MIKKTGNYQNGLKLDEALTDAEWECAVEAWNRRLE